MKNTYYTVFDWNYIAPLIDHAHDIADETIKGRRNKLNAAPHILRAMLFNGYYYNTAWCEPCWEKLPHITDKIKRGDIICRFNGRQLGCAIFSDYRQCLDIVYVDHVSKNMVIGTMKERVRAEQIICVCRAGIENNVKERSETK